MTFIPLSVKPMKLTARRATPIPVCVWCGASIYRIRVDKRGRSTKKICAECEARAKSRRQHLSHAVKEAVLSGELPALRGAIKCVDCGKPATLYDHRDYTQALNVSPVCKGCNVKRGPAEKVGWV